MISNDLESAEVRCSTGPQVSHLGDRELRDTGGGGNRQCCGWVTTSSPKRVSHRWWWGCSMVLPLPWVLGLSFSKAMNYSFDERQIVSIVWYQWYCSFFVWFDLEPVWTSILDGTFCALISLFGGFVTQSFGKVLSRQHGWPNTWYAPFVFKGGMLQQPLLVELRSSLKNLGTPETRCGGPPWYPWHHPMAARTHVKNTKRFYVMNPTAEPLDFIWQPEDRAEASERSATWDLHQRFWLTKEEMRAVKYAHHH